MTIEKEQLDKLNNNFEPEALKELKIHQEAVKDSSLLSHIREKEVEIKKKVIEAQIEADKVISDAQQEAEKLKPKIEAEAQKKVEKYYQDQMVKIQKEAEDFGKQTPKKLKEIERIGMQNLDKAINKLTELLIPR